MKLKKFNQINENGISAYDSVWVSFKNEDSDISEIFLNKSDAEKNTILRNEEFDKNFRSRYQINRNSPTYKTITLNDAIELIKDYVRSENDGWGDPSY